MVLNNFQPLPQSLKDFIKATGSDVFYDTVATVNKALQMESDRQMMSEFYALLYFDVQEIGKNLGVLCLAQNKKENKFEYVFDDMTERTPDDPLKTNNFLLKMLKYGVERAKLVLNTTIKFVIINYDFYIDVPLDINIFLTPSIYIKRIKNVSILDCTANLRGEDQDNFLQAVYNWKNGLRILENNFKTQKMSTAISCIIDFIADDTMNISEDKRVNIQNITIDYLKGFNLLCMLFNPIYVRKIFDLPQSEFKRALKREKNLAIDSLLAIDNSLVNAGNYLNEYGDLFGNLNYQNPDFWNDIRIVSRIPSVADFAINITQIWAECPKINIQSIIKEYSPTFKDFPNSEKLFKIISVRDI